jgi:hypothetical protein
MYTICNLESWDYQGNHNGSLQYRRNAPVGSSGRRRPLSPTPGQITPCASLRATQPAQPGGPDAVQQLRGV